MGRVFIVTDSAVQFPDSRYLESNLVRVLPAPIMIGNAALPMQTSTNVLDVREHFENSANAPVLSAPSVEQFTALYAELLQSTDTIISIHTSAAICGALANARSASQAFLGRSDIHIIDSEMISVGLGLLVQHAARAAARGEDSEEIVRIVRGMIPHMYTVFCLEDLMFLEHHGLVSLSQAILGNMLGIIPFLTLEDGHMIPMEKVRTRQRAVEKMIEFVTEFTGVDYLALLHGGGQAALEAKTLAERLEETYPGTPISIATYNPALATYIGLHGLGLVVLENAQEFV